MSAILLSTTNFHNCGDDFIREGLYKLLQIRPLVNTIWWNRGPGIKNKYLNDLNLNLRLIDYFILAGTPEWVAKNENIYKYCLKHDIPISIIGVGSHGGMHTHEQKKLLQRVAQSGLCEITLTRDMTAKMYLESVGFNNVGLVLDPAFFNSPIEYTGEKKNILTWRNLTYNYQSAYLRAQISAFLKRSVHFTKTGLKNIIHRKVRNQLTQKYNKLMRTLFVKMDEPKQVIVHENNELYEAQQIFGKDNVFYSSDYQLIYTEYSKAKTYLGSRIHGAIPSIIHGATATLIYDHQKASVLETAKSIFSGHNPEIGNVMNTLYIDNDMSNDLESKSFALKDLTYIIALEKDRIQNILKSVPVLSTYLSLK